MSKNKKQNSSHNITTNRKASHDYHLEERYEAGIVLHGWEVKSMRANRANLKESYISPNGDELFLVGAHISPDATTSTHAVVNPTRSRKLLLHRVEINRLLGSVERKGYSLIPTRFYWRDGRVKLEFALAKGKKQYDKRAAIKARDIERDRDRDLSRLN